MGRFLEDIFYFILFFYLIRKVFSFLVGTLFKNSVQNGSGARTSRNSTKHEGEIEINFVPPKKKQTHEDSGEFVDFEEIKKK